MRFGPCVRNWGLACSCAACVAIGGEPALSAVIARVEPSPTLPAVVIGKTDLAIGDHSDGRLPGEGAHLHMDDVFSMSSGSSRTDGWVPIGNGARRVIDQINAGWYDQDYVPQPRATIAPLVQPSNVSSLSSRAEG